MKALLSRLLIAAIIVIPSAFLYQRSVATTNATRTLATTQIDQAIDKCKAFNEQRVAQIATSEAAIRVANESPPALFTDHDRLLLAAFVVKANRAIEAATHPKVCTVASLHLQALASVANP